MQSIIDEPSISRSKPFIKHKPYLYSIREVQPAKTKLNLYGQGGQHNHLYRDFYMKDTNKEETKDPKAPYTLKIKKPKQDKTKTKKQRASRENRLLFKNRLNYGKIIHLGRTLQIYQEKDTLSVWELRC